MRPDFSTVRLLPWQSGEALVLCDFVHQDGKLVNEAPRSVLRKQVEALARKQLTCYTASELEFFLFHESYHDAFVAQYRNLTPSSDYRIDYHTLQPARDEFTFRAVRNWMSEAGVPVESSKGEWGRGKNRFSAAPQRGPRAKAETGSKLFREFLGGLMKYSPELCCFFAPTINSYKRYQSASWAPTKMAWSCDNRTVGFRVVGQKDSFRIENRMPGADANPYLAFAAMLAAGMAGMQEKLDCS